MRDAPPDAPVWSWTAAGPLPAPAGRDAARPRPDHLHARRERGQLVLIATGSAGGSIAGRLGGVRLPREAAVELARFILAGEDGGAS